jgi:uncharacterized phage-associated protein
MILTYHREKLINAIIYFAKNTKYCGKTKLLKLLYFLDFMHFKRTAKSVTGLIYSAWEKGPVPVKLYDELSGPMALDLKSAIHELPKDKEIFQQIRPKKDFNPDYFSPKEMNLLEEIAFIFHDAKAEHMVEVSHLRNEPWDKTLKEKGLFKKIDYMLALDSDLISISPEKAKERVEDRQEMYEIFGKD